MKLKKFKLPQDRSFAFSDCGSVADWFIPRPNSWLEALLSDQYDTPPNRGSVYSGYRFDSFDNIFFTGTPSQVARPSQFGRAIVDQASSTEQRHLDEFSRLTESEHSRELLRRFSNNPTTRRLFGDLWND